VLVHPYDQIFPFRDNLVRHLTQPKFLSRISEPAFGLLLLTLICWEDDY
jgi:hypothetical protein